MPCSCLHYLHTVTLHFNIGGGQLLDEVLERGGERGGIKRVYRGSKIDDDSILENEML